MYLKKCDCSLYYTLTILAQTSIINEHIYIHVVLQGPTGANRASPCL